jgi:hypothetical protein
MLEYILANHSEFNFMTIFNGCTQCKCKLVALGLAACVCVAAANQHPEYCGEWQRRAPAVCNNMLSWDLAHGENNNHGEHNNQRPMWQLYT